MIKGLPLPLQQLIAQFGDLTVEQQRARHLILMKRMLEAATMGQVRSLRRATLTCFLCEWLGEAHREALLNMIDGHIALRRLGVFRRSPAD